MTNAEAIIQGLNYLDECNAVVDYIACPYVSNPDCKYDGGKDSSCCDECKLDWLVKEWVD